MNIESFFSHWGIEENPFKAEEARDDPVYLRMMKSGMTHPDFEKIIGSPSRPSTAVVFGDKGSGKTAIKMLLLDKLKDYNERNPEGRTYVVVQDEFNPFLDQISKAYGFSEINEKNLEKIRLEDHMDSILSKATTELVDFFVDRGELGLEMKSKERTKLLKDMPRHKRLDLAHLAAIYDAPSTRNADSRWGKLTRRLPQIRNFLTWKRSGILAIVFLVATLIVGTMATMGGKDKDAEQAAVQMNAPVIQVAQVDANKPAVVEDEGRSGLGTFGLYILTGACGLGFLFFGWQYIFGRFRFGRISRKIAKDVKIMGLQPKEVSSKLSDLGWDDIHSLPIPSAEDNDARYEMFRRLRGILEEIGYKTMIVIVDRVDEPTSVHGQTEKMQKLIWPMLDNKFLQMDGVGFKMLIPLELGQMLRRESAEFFQKARLDKQNLIEMSWSGSTLYDICSKRLKSCLRDDAKLEKLTDMFGDGVEAKDLIESLEQMHQPRDAFKLLYSVLQEHCTNTTDENPQFQIPRLVLDQIRKQQSQRVQEFSRGISPA